MLKLLRDINVNHLHAAVYVMSSQKLPAGVVLKLTTLLLYCFENHDHCNPSWNGTVITVLVITVCAVLPILFYISQ